MPARRKKIAHSKPENTAQLFWLGLIALVLGGIALQGVRGARSMAQPGSDLSRDPAQALIAPSGLPR